MRIALVGLSTPILYDGARQTFRVNRNRWGSPNPILDSPFGLLLLYDEIWFLTRSLCPRNMRKLPYVRFLDEEGKLPGLNDVKIPNLDSILATNDTLAHNYQRFIDRFCIDVTTINQKLGIQWEALLDYHTHDLNVGGVRISARSIDPVRLFLDMEIVRRLEQPNVELITNSFSQQWFETPNNPIAKIKLAELLVIDNIPNYLSVDGPYHPCIEEARENPYLQSFRKWISSQPQHSTDVELLEVKREVEASIQEMQNKLFLKFLDPKARFLSAGKTLVGVGMDLLVPYSSTVTSLAEELKSYFDRRERRWQGFIVSTRELR